MNGVLCHFKKLKGTSVKKGGCVIEHVESDGTKNVWDTKWHVAVVNYARAHTQSQAMLHSLKHGLLRGCGVIYASHHVHPHDTDKRGLLRASWDSQRSPAPCNWHGPQLHDCVLLYRRQRETFSKMLVPQGIRWLQMVSFLSHIRVITCLYTPLVGIMSWTAQSRASVIRAVSASCWELHGLTGPGLMIPTPHLKCQRHWCLNVYSMSDFLLLFLFQVRSCSCSCSCSSSSSSSSSSGHHRGYGPHFSNYFWSCPWPRK